jgi:hypothetical protein
MMEWQANDDNWKGFVRKRSWFDFKVLSRHSPGGTEVMAEGLDMSRPEAVATGGKINPSGSLPSAKRTGWMNVWELNSEEMGSLCLKASGSWGNSFWLSVCATWGVGSSQQVTEHSRVYYRIPSSSSIHPQFEERAMALWQGTHNMDIRRY